MPELPKRMNTSDMTPADAKALLDIMPNVASYLAACVSKGGKDSVVRVQLIGVCDNKKWGMDVTIPGHLIQDIEHISGLNIPRPDTVLENLSIQPPVPNGEVIAKVDVAADNQTPDWPGDLD